MENSALCGIPDIEKSCKTDRTREYTQHNTAIGVKSRRLRGNRRSTSVPAMHSNVHAS